MVPPALSPSLLMIRLMPILTVIVALSICSLHAGASNKNGSPFSQNGTFFNNSGTYTAIMRGQNLMGVSQFSVYADGTVPSSGWNMLNGASSNNITPGTTNNIGTPGFVSLYYNGTTYNGPAFSVLDPGGAQIGSVFYTYSAGGQQWNSGSTGFTNTPTNGVYHYYDGYWNAALQNKYPNQVFYGNGCVSLGATNVVAPNLTNSPINMANGQAGVIQIPFSVQGTRVSGSASQIY